MSKLQNLKPQLKSILTLGLPLAGTHLAQFSIHIVDTIMLGWYGIPELAACALSGIFFFSIMTFGLGFAFAVMPMVASAASKGDDIRVRRVTRMGMWLSVIFVVLTFPILIWSELIFLSLGQEPMIAALSVEYLRVLAFAMAPMLIIMVLSSYLSALEKTQAILWITVLSVVLNSVLNWIFIFGKLGFPELGLTGAAVASVAAQLMALWVVILYISKNKELKKYTIFVRIYKVDWNAFIEVFRLGWPIGLTHLAETCLFASAGFFMGLVSIEALAAHGIAMEVVALTFMLHIGLSKAATVRVSYALGVRDGSSLIGAIIGACVLSLSVVFCVVLVFLTIPDVIVSLFLNPEDPQREKIITIGVSLLTVGAIYQLTDAGQVMILSILRGLQDTKVPMFVAAFGYLAIGIPMCYLVGIYLGYGAPGVWMGLVAGLGVVCFLLGLRLLFVLKHLKMNL